ncbi:MAG: MBL fold metallo-hydrolase [Nitrospirae bacterium]|nr:MBL fold metallo-hydrolase [Nitrospirota bacterium]
MVAIEEYREMDISQPVEVVPGIWWIGAEDEDSHLKCHSYLLVDGEDAVLFEPGSLLHHQSIFQRVIKIVPLRKIRHIVLTHQDTDVCGSLPAWEMAFNSIPFHIVTHSRTVVFIKQYGISFPIYPIDQMYWNLKLSSGRILRFIFAPWCHSPGTFMTYDEKSRSLFSGDIFGAITNKWSFYADHFYVEAMRSFHDDYMASTRHLQYAMSKLAPLSIDRILPQHGSIINRDVLHYIHALSSSRCGIDLLCGDDPYRIGVKDVPLPVSGSLGNSTMANYSGLPIGYRYIIARVIEREMGVLGKEDATATARQVRGIHLDSEGNLIAIREKDGKDILNRLLSAYEKRFGFWAVFNCRLMLHNLIREFGLKMPDILDGKITNEQS